MALEESWVAGMDTGDLVDRTTELAMSLGDAGRVGLVWTAVALAVWQVTVFAGQFLFQAGSSILPDSTARFLGGLDGDGKSQFISHNARDTIEMAFWTVNFIEHFEKEWRRSGLAAEGRSDEDEELEGRFSNKKGLFGHNTRVFIKMMRYVIKWIGTFDAMTKHSKG